MTSSAPTETVLPARNSVASAGETSIAAMDPTIANLSIMDVPFLGPP